MPKRLRGLYVSVRCAYAHLAALLLSNKGLNNFLFNPFIYGSVTAVYLLYLDDSGSPSNKKESHFILGGFIVPENKLYWVNKNLNDLEARLKITSNSEFHASAISGGKVPWKFFDRHKRHEIIKDVLRAAEYEKNNITILSCAVEKAYYSEQDPVQLAFEDICSRFQLFLKRMYSQKKENATGLIILDEMSYKESLQSLAKQFQQRGNKWNQKMEHVHEAPMFVDSKASRGIQLADHIAYSIFRRYEFADLSYYNVFEGFFDSEDGKIHGICHMTKNKLCTCAHCAQKRIINN
ncbi:MAG: DUF3800 domain-containing protein [Defluviitaleaceae bacterium]|nr:DUF3800 domain-containing protein [Defluviitaleaceae bacterium]MCL2238738.1 DUF3800 domain-containing protein [Defluviitaleaceae bacterium]